MEIRGISWFGAAYALLWLLTLGAGTAGAVWPVYLPDPEKPIVFTHSDSLPPYSYLDDGVAKGMYVDFWTLWAKRNGVDIRFKLVPFFESIRLVEEGGADVHMGMYPSASRRRIFDFSGGILQLDYSLYVYGGQQIATMDQLVDKRVPVGVVLGDYSESYLRGRYPDMDLRVFDSNEQLFRAVAMEELKAVARDRFSVLYAQSSLHLGGKLEPVEDLYGYKASAAVKKGRGDLLKFINHGLAMVGEREKSEILNRWINYQSQMPGWFWKGVAVLLGALGLAALLFHLFVLRYQVRRKTSELSRAMDMLKSQEEKYRAIFENATEGIFLTTDKGCLREANQACADIFGFKDVAELKDHLGREGAKKLYLDSKERGKVMDTIFQRGGIHNYDLRMVKKDGSSIWVRVSCRPLVESGTNLLEGILRDVTEEKSTELSLLYRATRDALTGLPNRYLFEDRLEHALAGARRHGRKLVLLFIDLDDFKKVNDRHGHHVGDMVLSQMARRLMARTREADTAARMGGDEFAMILESASSVEEAIPLARDLAETICRPYAVEGRTLTIGTSIGIVCFPDDGEDPGELMRKADRAMYTAKKMSSVYYLARDLG